MINNAHTASANTMRPGLTATSGPAATGAGAAAAGDDSADDLVSMARADDTKSGSAAGVEPEAGL